MIVSRKSFSQGKNTDVNYFCFYDCKRHNGFGGACAVIISTLYIFEWHLGAELLVRKLKKIHLWLTAGSVKQGTNRFHILLKHSN